MNDLQPLHLPILGQEEASQCVQFDSGLLYIYLVVRVSSRPVVKASTHFEDGQ